MVSIIGRAFISKVFAGVGVLALNFLLGYYYGVGGVGQFMMLLSILVGISMLVRVGMDNALIRDLSISHKMGDGKKFLEDIACSFVWCSLCSLVIVILFLSFPVLTYDMDASVLSPMMMSLPFYSLVCLQSNILKALGYAAIAPFFETGSVAFILSLYICILQYIGFYELNYVAWGFLYSSVAVFLLGAVLLSIKFFWLDKFSKKIEMKSVCVIPWKKFKGLNSFLILSANAYFTQWGTILMLGYLLSKEDVGAFTLAHRTTLLISFILIVINGVVGPRFSYMHSRNDKASLQGLVSKTFWIGLAMSFPMFLFISIFGGIIINSLMSDINNMTFFLVILGGGQVVNVLTGPSANLLMMTGNERHLRNYTLLFSGFSFFALIPASLSYGVIGAVVVISFVESLKNIVLMLFVNRTLGLQVIPWQWLLKYVK